MALSDKQISQMWSDAHNDTSDRMANQVFAKAIEAEVHKQDTELIRQMLDALDGAIAITMGKIDLRNAAIAAARARLEGKP